MGFNLNWEFSIPMRDLRRYFAKIISAMISYSAIRFKREKKMSNPLLEFYNDQAVVANGSLIDGPNYNQVPRELYLNLGYETCQEWDCTDWNGRLHSHRCSICEYWMNGGTYILLSVNLWNVKVVDVEKARYAVEKSDFRWELFKFLPLIFKNAIRTFAICCVRNGRVFPEFIRIITEIILREVNFQERLRFCKSCTTLYAEEEDNGFITWMALEGKKRYLV